MKANMGQKYANASGSGNGRHVLFYILPFLIVGIVAVFLFLVGFAPVEFPKVHAQADGVLGVNCNDYKTDVKAIPRTPGAKARYVINFLNGERALLPEQDGIVFLVDSQIQLPRRINATKIDIHYTYSPPSDVATPVTVSFGVFEYTVPEGNSVTVTVKLDRDPLRSVTIPLTEDRIPGARSSDYSGVPDFLTFRSGETSKEFIFAATKDSDGKSVELGFGPLPEGVTTEGDGSKATVTIKPPVETPLLVDPEVTVSFGESDYNVTEGSTVTVEVTLSPVPGRSVTIELTEDRRGSTSSSDYSGVPEFVTFGSSETSKKFIFAADPDNRVDNRESVVLGFETDTLPAGVEVKEEPNKEATVSITDSSGATPKPYGSGRASSVEVTEPGRRGGPATLTIYPKIVEGGSSRPIPANAEVRVVIHDDAGLSNPIEGGSFQWDVGTTHDPDTFCVTRHPDLAVINAFRRMDEAIDSHVHDAETDGLLIDWEVELSKPTVSRGEQLEFTGRGFAVGTTVIFWRDSNMNGLFDGLGAVLCRARSDSQAIAKCSIPVTNPPFSPGFGDCAFEIKGREPPNNGGLGEVVGNNCNFINARDGEGHTSILVVEGGMPNNSENKYDGKDALQVLELAGSVDLGTLLRPHPSVQVELFDFPQGHLESVAIGGFRADLEGLGNRQISGKGRLSFSLALPGDVLPGRQDIRVTVEENVGACERDSGESGDGYCHEYHSEVTIDSSIQVEVSPSTALPNQRVRLTIQGFQGTDIGRISMDGIKIEGAEHCDDVDELIQLDSSGRWVGTVVLPVNGSTLLGGERKLQVRDCQRRLGETVIVFPPREIRVSPAQAVPGETVTISGEGFPVSSNRSSEFRAEVTYDYGGGQSSTSVSIDANGRFSTDMTVPRAAGVPSSNLVSAEFMDDDGHPIYTNTTHGVTAATVAASPDHGPPGTVITVTGRGFWPFTPVTRVLMGEVDVTPSPAPYTDRNGMVEFEVLVPQSDVGLESILVLAGGIYVLADFQVGMPLVETGPVTAIEELDAMLGDNLLVSFHFGNDTKVWTFHEPSFPEEGGLELLVPGESYYIQVRESVEAILNGKTRHLSCKEGNCWNLITW